MNALSGPTKAAALSLDELLLQAQAREIPVAGHLQSSVTVPVRPAEDMWEQWENSQMLRHPLLEPPVLEATLDQLRSLRSQMREETDTWFQNLPKHVASAYTYDGDQIVQIPMLMRLLRGCGYPDCDNLEKELCSGFPLIGKLSRSPGWHARTDDWYDHPIAEDVFAVLVFR
eukprot:s2000_g11.t1